MADGTIIWRRLDRPGHESARVSYTDPYWQLEGAAVFVHEQQACRLDYQITCDSEWRTLSGKVAGWVGNEIVAIDLSVDSAGRWQLNGEECTAATGCVDLDLNFSPSTNLLPIRRLNLSIGEDAMVRAAWLRFPSFKLEPLEQLYRRVELNTYRYESAGGKFVAELQVNDAGLVTNYPGVWQAVR